MCFLKMQRSRAYLLSLGLLIHSYPPVTSSFCLWASLCCFSFLSPILTLGPAVLTWELVSKADSLGCLQTYWIRVCREAWSERASSRALPWRFYNSFTTFPECRGSTCPLRQFWLSWGSSNRSSFLTWGLGMNWEPVLQDRGTLTVPPQASCLTSSEPPLPRDRSCTSLA